MKRWKRKSGSKLKTINQSATKREEVKYFIWEGEGNERAEVRLKDTSRTS